MSTSSSKTTPSMSLKELESWINDKKLSVIASVACRDCGQYRLFFSDKYALYTTIGKDRNGDNAVIGHMPILLEHVVKCICSQKLTTGSERIFFGSTDGYIYRMNAGSSFDGAPIPHRLKLIFNHTKSPRTLKRYRKLALEIQGQTYSEFLASYVLGYGTTEVVQPGNVLLTSSYSPAFWDSFIWDAFYWDGTSLIPTELGLEGTEVNLALLITGSSDSIYPFTIAGVFLHYSPRRGLR